MAAMMDDDDEIDVVNDDIVVKDEFDAVEDDNIVFDVDCNEFEYLSDIEGARERAPGDEEATGVESETSAADETDYCCHRFCVRLFDKAFRAELKEALSELSKSEKQIYLFGMISIDEERQQCTGLRRTSSKIFQYTVKMRGRESLVCKRAFMMLHDTTDAVMRTLCTKMTKNYLIPTDDRGKHDNFNRISSSTRDLIEAHFYAVLESPTIFKCVKGKQQSGEPHIKNLWTDFIERYGELGFSVSRQTYSKYIKSFLTPDVLSKFRCAYFAYQQTQQFTKK